MINFKEALEFVDVLKEDDCITTLYQGIAIETIRQTLLKAQGMEKELDFLKFLFCAKILPAARKYIDEEAQMFNLSFTFKKDSEAYNLLKELLKDD